VTDEEFIAEVVTACRRLPNAEGVTLGGSRARGDNRPDSDWDFGVYYRGELDVAVFERLGWSGHVYRPFDWGRVMYGGAVFDLDSRHFDIHYRNLDVVKQWTAEAEEGRFEIHILGFHLAGIPTYMLPGELATSNVLWGSLPKPSYPAALRRSAPAHWLQRAFSELGYSHYWASTANPVSCAGALARAVLQCAHARLAHRGVWALNEKRMVQAADLTGLYQLFSSLGASARRLERAIEEVERTAHSIAEESGVRVP